jgi:hypothetical protein
MRHLFKGRVKAPIRLHRSPTSVTDSSASERERREDVGERVLVVVAQPDFHRQIIEFGRGADEIGDALNDGLEGGACVIGRER